VTGWACSWTAAPRPENTSESAVRAYFKGPNAADLKATVSVFAEDGSVMAVATIVASIELMNSPTSTIPKTSRRDGPGSPADGACKPTERSIATVVSLPNDCDGGFRRALKGRTKASQPGQPA